MAGDLLPYFKVFPAETLADERFSSWTMEERGAWLSLLLHAWVNGSIPADTAAIARILHITEEALRPLWEGIADRFVPHPDAAGRLTSRRLEMEREEALAKSLAGTKAANSRWGKKNPPDATAMRPHSDRNADPIRPPMPSAQRSAAQRNTALPPVSEALASEDAWGRVSGVWDKVCVPAGFAKARGTAAQKKAAQTRMREAGWFDAFLAACQHAASDPFYRGGGKTGWVMDLGWLLKPNNAEKTADRATTRRVNGNGDRPEDAAMRAALAEAERYAAGGATLPGDEGDDGGARCSPPLDPAEGALAEDGASLLASLGATVVRGRLPGKLQDAAGLEPGARHGGAQTEGPRREP